MSDLLPAPTDLGAPDHFQAWRPDQPAAILRAIDSERRFVGLVMPTGSGKSLTYVATHLLTGARTLILTSTKGLQTQLLRDFEPTGMVDVRGQNAYECIALQNELAEYASHDGRSSCEEGPCHAGIECTRRPSRSNPGATGCLYYDAIAKARRSRLVVTNYKFWMSQELYGQGLGQFDQLVLDEAHNAPDELASFLSTKVTLKDIEVIARSKVPADPADLAQWREWAGARAEWLTNLLEQWRPQSRQEISLHRQSRHVLRKLELLKRLDPLSWIVIEKGNEWTFDPVWASAYAESTLFLHTPKIIFTSATFNAKTAELMGVSGPELDLHEVASGFPIPRRPVIWIPTVRVDHRADESMERLWLARIDQIIRARSDRNGIIHTISYARRNKILQHSEFASRMITHDRENTRAAVERFKYAPPGSILLSPSMTTGWDFPYEECEYQIILKVPFPDSRDPIMQARTLQDRDYPAYIAMQQLVQAVGRGMRAPDDQCECVAPGTRVLTDDLRWVPAGTLRDGDRLLAFDEQGRGRGYRRKWRTAFVVKSVTRKMPRMRVLLSNDRSVVCTPNHPWLILPRGSNVHTWRRSDELKRGTRLARFFTPWDDATTYAQGWLAGIADGEGSLVLRAGKRNPNVTGIYLVQNFGPVLFEIERRLRERGYQFSTSMGANGRICHVKIKGGFPEHVRFLGEMRPVRLLHKFLSSERNEDARAGARLEVADVAALSDGPITSLQTSTGTYIAEGLGAHNTFIIDDHVGWFLSKNKHLAPQWFLRAFRKSETIPQPPVSLRSA